VREAEFLPEWYPRTRQRRRLVVLQGWLILTLIAGMGAYLGLSDRNIRTDVDSRTALQGQLDQTNAQLAEMDKLVVMRQQLRQQEQIVSRLGFYVEACKTLDKLDALMPKQMSLTELQLDNEERIDNSAIQQAKGPADAAVDRRLKIRLQGVCPTGVDLATFMTQLQNIPFFEGVNVSYAKEKSESNHVMREFEISFSLSLNSYGS
jgi:Tfp pilus assembly protein PilN